MKLEKFPRIDPELVKILEEIYTPLEYDPSVSSEQFTKKAAYRAGQIEVVNKLKAVMKQQQGGK